MCVYIATHWGGVFVTERHCKKMHCKKMHCETPFRSRGFGEEIAEFVLSLHSALRKNFGPAV